jgi:hypothetical protein
MAAVVALIACCLIHAPSAALAGAPHFVVDIDNVLLDWAAHDRPDDKVINGTIDGTARIVADGAGEFLASLLAIPGAKLSFYSAKPMEIIERSLNAVRLPDGRSALGIASSVHSSAIRIGEGKNYRVLPHKDLHAVVGAQDLADVVLIDDSKGNAAPGQERNLLWAQRLSESRLHESYENHREQLTASGEFRDGAPFSTAQAFVADRNSLVRVRGLLEVAMQRARERGSSLTEALAALQWKADGRLEPREDLMTNLEYYRRGLRLLKQQNQGFRFVPVAGRAQRKIPVKVGKLPAASRAMGPARSPVAVRSSGTR